MEVGIAVRDLPAMRRFYEELLGFRLISEIVVPAASARQAALSDHGYTVVRLQTPRGERLKLLRPGRLPAAVTGGTGSILDQGQAIYLTFIVDDIQPTIAALTAAGVAFLTGPQRVEVRPGTYLAFFRDPEGNLIELVQYADIAAYRPDLLERKA